MAVTSLRPAEALLARCTFASPGTEVTCAVSGGADSTAMLALAIAAGCRVTAMHVDHGLRDGSASEADHVRDLASTLGARFVARTVHVAAGPNLEERARDARASVLPADSLLGHTADDQAQTVLWHLLRGAGPAGLAAMSADRRPILALRRTETHALCAELGLSVITDPMNADPSFTRNRVRDEVIPLLSEVAGRDVVPLICRAALHQREVVDLLDSLVADVDATDARSLADCPAAVAAMAVRAAWRSETGSNHSPDAAAIGRILDVAAMRAESCDVVAGWRVVRSGGRLRWQRPVG